MLIFKLAKRLDQIVWHFLREPMCIRIGVFLNISDGTSSKFHENFFRISQTNSHFAKINFARGSWNCADFCATKICDILEKLCTFLLFPKFLINQFAKKMRHFCDAKSTKEHVKFVWDKKCKISRKKKKICEICTKLFFQFAEKFSGGGGGGRRDDCSAKQTTQFSVKPFRVSCEETIKNIL